jgi:hypothetical protein
MTTIENEKARAREIREHVAAGGGLIFKLACGHDLHLARPTPVERVAKVGRTAMCHECESMKTINAIELRPFTSKRAPTKAPERFEIYKPRATVLGDASEVRVGDFVKSPKESELAPFRRVRGVYRLEAGIQILVANGPAGVSLIDASEDTEIEIVSRLGGGALGILYRVPHPARSGCVAFVSIPED